MDEQDLHSAIVRLAASLDHPSCLLLVHPDVHRLAEAAGEVSSIYGWPRLSIGGELAAALLSEPVQVRPRAARRWLGDRLGSMSPGPALCTNIDLLFEPSLALDPLGLLCAVSRRTRLVVAWPGSYVDGVLAYAVPEHAQYRTWRQPSVGVVSLG